MNPHRPRSVQRSHHPRRFRVRMKLARGDAHVADGRDHVHEGILSSRTEVLVIAEEINFPVGTVFRIPDLLNSQRRSVERYEAGTFRFEVDLEISGPVLLPVSRPRHFHLHLAVADARVLHDNETIPAAVQLEPDVQLSGDRSDHIQPPLGYVPRDDQVLDTLWIESNLEWVLVYEPVVNRNEILRVRTSAIVRIGTDDSPIGESTSESVAAHRPAFQLRPDHRAEIVTFVEDIGQRHVHQHVVRALWPVSVPIGILVLLVDGHACRK